VDERTRYFRRLKRLRNSARRWSVLGGGLVAATAVLTPYSGIGIADAIWAGAAGSSAALAWWRWSDHRALAAIPAPPAPNPALAGQRLTAAIERFPAGRSVMNEVRRQKNRYALRGSAITQAWDRLDRASATLTGLAGRLTGPGEAAVLEAAVAEQGLRDLGQRGASGERAIPLSPPGTAEPPSRNHTPAWPGSSPTASPPTSASWPPRPATSPRTATRWATASTRPTPAWSTRPTGCAGSPRRWESSSAHPRPRSSPAPAP